MQYILLSVNNGRCLCLSAQLWKGGIHINPIELSEQEQAILQAMERLRSVQLGWLYPSLSPGEGRLLGILVCEGSGLSVSALSEELNMPMPAVSRLMRGMEERGLIERKIMPQDRRSILVSITPEGRRIHEDLCQFFHSFFTELLSSIEPNDFKQMITSWNLLMDRMEILMSIYNTRMKQAAKGSGAFESKEETATASIQKGDT